MMCNTFLKIYFFAMFSSLDGKKYELYSRNLVDNITHSVGPVQSRFVIDIVTSVKYECYDGDEYTTTINVLGRNIKLYIEAP